MTDLSRARRVPIALLGMLAAACGGERFSDRQGPSDAGPGDLRPVDEDSGAGGPPSTPLPDVPSPVLEASVVGGISVLPPGGLVTTEGGDQASFEVVLVDRPTANVTIGLESSDPGEGTISVDSLTFTRNDWDTPQTVVVTGQDDDEVDGHQGYTIVTLPAESNDPQYDGVDAADVAIANLDDDELGVRFEPASGLITSETGQQAHVTARLSSRPKDDVAVFLGSSDTSEGVVTPAALTFTPNNWDSPKMITVTGQDDEDPDGPVAYQLVITDIVSGDEDYAGLDTKAFRAEIENTDDDSAGVTVTAEDLVVSEGGETATFTVALNRAPTELVLIPVSSSDETEGTVLPQLLSFTPDNWNAPQEIVVTGVDDDEADGDQEFIVQLDDALSSDSAYDGLDVPDVTVTNIDDESAGFTVQPGQVEVSESETSDTFEVRLTTQPSAQVVVGLSVNDPSEASLDTTELVFTESNWQTPQTVVVTGVDDDEVDGNQPFVVQTAPAQSEDDAYRGKNPPDVMGLTLDDETAGVTVTPTTGLVTSEDGTQAQFEVALLSAPTSRVHISLTSDDLGEGEVDPSELQFDADNWDTPQTVVVTGVDDATTDGAQPYTVVTELETNDPAYSEVVVADVEVINRDDECPVPELVDDFEDGDLVICPSVGRAGTWVGENAAAGEWMLETKSAGRGQSDFALFGSYARDSSTDPMSGTDPFLAFPVLAVLLRAPEGDGSPQPFDASASNGIRFWARATPGGTLSVALGTVDTWATGAAAQAQCLGGCTGHFTTTVEVDSTWQNYAIDFDSFAGSVAKGDAVFDPAKLLGLKFAIASDVDAELWLDDVTFVQ